MDIFLIIVYYLFGVNGLINEKMSDFQSWNWRVSKYSNETFEIRRGKMFRVSE